MPQNSVLLTKYVPNQTLQPTVLRWRLSLRRYTLRRHNL